MAKTILKTFYSQERASWCVASVVGVATYMVIESGFDSEEEAKLMINLIEEDREAYYA